MMRGSKVWFSIQKYKWISCNTIFLGKRKNKFLIKFNELYTRSCHFLTSIVANSWKTEFIRELINLSRTVNLKNAEFVTQLHITLSSCCSSKTLTFIFWRRGEESRNFSLRYHRFMRWWYDTMNCLVSGMIFSQTVPLRNRFLWRHSLFPVL